MGGHLEDSRRRLLVGCKMGPQTAAGGELRRCAPRQNLTEAIQNGGHSAPLPRSRELEWRRPSPQAWPGGVKVPPATHFVIDDGAPARRAIALNCGKRDWDHGRLRALHWDAARADLASRMLLGRRTCAACSPPGVAGPERVGSGLDTCAQSSKWLWIASWCMWHEEVPCPSCCALGTDLAECVVVRATVVQLIASAPSPGSGPPPSTNFWRVVDVGVPL